MKKETPKFNPVPLCPPRPPLSSLAKKVCEKYNVFEKELRFGIRRNILVQARRAISWFRARELGYSGADVDKELMIYFLWQTGLFANRKISGLFGLSYSSISR
ncbi:MAG: hypothetical protein U9R02_10130 [Thermodesulfobacteriota bacterium]|nr:hypothetical protein [Thermodesulfobacteriota bacterium]